MNTLAASICFVVSFASGGVSLTSTRVLWRLRERRLAILGAITMLLNFALAVHWAVHLLLR